MRTSFAVILVALAACGGDVRPIELPDVPTGAFEAACQTMCARMDGDTGCTADHAAYCLASCRVRTNGLTAACGQCLVAAGEQIHGFMDGAGDLACAVGGPAELGDACATECDDGGAAPSAPSLSQLCELQCKFYMQDPAPLACTADGSAMCLSECAAAVSGQGRICAQCVIEGVIPSRTCINDVCDCEPFFNSDPSFECAGLCDDRPPAS